MSRTKIVALLPKQNHGHEDLSQLPLWNGQWDVTKFLLRLWVQDSDFVGAPWLLPSRSSPPPLPYGISDAFRNLLVPPWPNLEPGSNFCFHHHRDRRQRQHLLIDLFDLLVTRGLNPNHIYYTFPREGGERTEVLDSEAGLLHIAAVRGSRTELGPLLGHMLSISRVDLNLVNRFGLTPLHVAVYHGQLNAVRLLIAAGASLELKWRSGGQEVTPLELATRKGDGGEECAFLLLDAGAEVRLCHVLTSIRVGNLKFASELLQHWRPELSGDGEDCQDQRRRLSYDDLNLGIDFFRARRTADAFQDVKTFIVHCVAHGLRVADDPNRITGNSLLHDCIKYGQPDLYNWIIVEFLDQSSDTVTPLPFTVCGYSLLHFAIKYSFSGLPRILYDACWTTQELLTPTGLSPLHLAVAAQNWDGVVRLLAKFKGTSLAVTVASKAPLSGILCEVKLGLTYARLEYLLGQSIHVEAEDDEDLLLARYGDEDEDARRSQQQRRKAKMKMKFKDREDSPPELEEAAYKVLSQIVGSSEWTSLQVAFATGNVAIVESLLEAAGGNTNTGDGLAEFRLACLSAEPALVLLALQHCVPLTTSLAGAQIYGIPAMTVLTKYVSIQSKDSCNQMGQTLHEVATRGYDFWAHKQESTDTNWHRAPFLVHLLQKRSYRVVRLLHRPDLPPINPNIKYEGQDLVSFLLTSCSRARWQETCQLIKWLLRNCFDATVIQQLPYYKFYEEDTEILRLLLRCGARFEGFRINCTPVYMRSMEAFEKFCDEMAEYETDHAGGAKQLSLMHLCRMRLRKMPGCNLGLNLVGGRDVSGWGVEIPSVVTSFIRLEDLSPRLAPKQLEAKASQAELVRDRNSAENKFIFMPRAEFEFRREEWEEVTNKSEIRARLQAWTTWSSSMTTRTLGRGGRV